MSQHRVLLKLLEYVNNTINPLIDGAHCSGLMYLQILYGNQTTTNVYYEICPKIILF